MWIFWNLCNFWKRRNSKQLIWWRRRPEAAGTGGGNGYDTDSDWDTCSGGGGSGWIFTESTYNTWRSGNSTDANQYLLKDHPEYYLTNAQTITGNTSFTSPTGSNETGHSGNGYARITALD